MRVPRDQIARAFSGAHGYEAHAPVQREVARALAARIAALDLPSDFRGLEIGCGTGFLTRELQAAGVTGDWLVTDLSPEMVARCRAALGESDRHQYAALDGESGTPEGGPFDLLCSSLALQWFADAPAALARMAGWLAPGGHLVVTTLGPETFAEWRAAHEALGLVPGTPAFLPAEAYTQLPGADVTVTRHVQRSADARAFLRSVKAIGAGTAHGAHTPLTPKQLREVMAQFDINGSTATYEVVTIHLTRPPIRTR
ncbi:methyltransferase [Novosphingobium mangrovi (ex Hu et al. 2023)]|uniref:Methyltransferase domain-containing protein n=1 Tax=Novosphingobium mangrovi (ex Hu et al. 2023) TaxID=2930094 RepID=A0ABT0AFQ8_9SPHN|nr:methyltransferase [Novosphingobium mangrovi (ex Hu et al. 2023)]MCJ1962035.1 methyltransferase domain-containing protein [Novosphingobium mangrovi (ex Hu et al. 2023)]